jgi:excisionase family DNA binding protein
VDEGKKVLTVDELAQVLGISVNLAYRQVRGGIIYSIKCGDRYLIPKRSLERLLAGPEGAGAGLPAPVLKAEEAADGKRA